MQGASEQDRASGVVETLRSLVFAFVLAMTFRGFVVEGFVIPTGSMAPTLLGQHLLKHSDQTGQDFAVGFSSGRPVNTSRMIDPMLGRNQPLPASEARDFSPKGGDRVLVLKTLYPFFDPDRFDVVVFKNPTDTQGPSGNYIKRLIGLPGETIWIADGDVFAGEDEQSLHVQRKPESVQRALWRLVHDSDAVPIDRLALDRVWPGPPWVGRPDGEWTFEDRTWFCESAARSELVWDHNRLPIDDWLPYNMIMEGKRSRPVSDVQVAATIVAEDAALTAQFELQTRGHRFVWSIGDQGGHLAMELLRGNGPRTEVSFEFGGFEPGQPVRLECWHVDQTMVVFVNGERTAELWYDWGPEERLRYATGAGDAPPLSQLAGRWGGAPGLRWVFDGSPATIERILVGRDLHYRSDTIPTRAQKNPTLSGNESLVAIGSPAFGTHPDKLAVLGEDHFLMAGDNSPYSLDGRLWGNPDPFVAAQLDPSPFVVHRDLLIGKAWSVYWPAAHRLGNLQIVPDLGNIRFIR
ncbi:MAG: S26 family signal peptidase [Phycisphaerales bacterium]|nr:S26 family signal peptidase [Phycisphaerales bacterium]